MTVPGDTLALARALVRLAEARMSPRRRVREQAVLERRLTRALARAFRAEGRAFLRRLDSVAALVDAGAPLNESIRESDWLPLLDEALLETLELFTAPLSAVMASAIEAGARASIAELAAEISFDLANPRAVTWLQEHGATLVAGIQETTRREMRTILIRATDEGWSYNQIARTIRARYAQFAVGVPQRHLRSRAELVAVTEVGNAYSESSMIVGRDLAAAGLEMEKRWLPVADPRIDAVCTQNGDAGWIALADQFPSGHDRPLAHPACRCTLLLRRRPEVRR